MNDDTLMNARTGRTSLTTNATGRFRVWLMAETQRERQEPVRMVSFDVHVLTGHTCAINGVVNTMNASLDNTYSCDCSSGWTGEAGEIQPLSTADSAAASDSDSDSDSALPIVALGAVIGLMLVVLIGFRVQVCRLKHRPVDVSGMSAEVMQSLGLVATTNIGPNEFGITLHFDECPRDGSDELSQQFKSDLIATLRKATPQIKDALDSAKTTVPPLMGRQNGHSQSKPKQVLVVLQTALVKAAAASAVETVVETLRKKAAKGKLQVGSTLQIIDASVAMRTNVPREINRQGLTRLKMLGEGAFGEVHQYQLEEKGHSHAVYVAAKSIKGGKAGSDDAREALLREATLNALLAHRNIVKTVGICTTPRDVPALLLLAYCEHGTVAAHCADATPASITVAERMTYCAQVLQGLQFIAHRRIVHRDVAARNVLLDATMTCRIGDFGMATALVEEGREYVRSNDKLALRWCSGEVISEGKYSAQSDVWAFGVFAYEVFNCGPLPYADQFDNLTEVSAFIKDGGKLNRPNHEACPQAIYDELMLPCFNAAPTDRPTFGELCDCSVRHGAEEDEIALEAREKMRQKRRGIIAAHQKPGDRSLLGLSVEHLRAVCVPKVLTAIDTIRKGTDHQHQSSFDSLLASSAASIWLAVQA